MDEKVVTSETELDSSPTKQLNDTDKQILEWAGKLEMESIDLREKASQLLNLMQRRCSEMLEAQQGLNGWKNNMNGELLSFKKEVLKILQDGNRTVVDEMKKLLPTGAYNGRTRKSSSSSMPSVPIFPDIEKFSSKIIKSFESRQSKWCKEFQSTQNVLYNVTVQMDRVTEVLGNMSQDIQRLSERQVQLEQLALSHRKEQCSEHLPSTPPPSFINSKKRSLSPLREDSISNRTRDKMYQTRYIIPWEDISDQEL